MNRWIPSGLLVLTSCALDPATPTGVPDAPPGVPERITSVPAAPSSLPLSAAARLPERVNCDALPELADPRNESGRGSAYELHGVVLSGDHFHGGCASESDASGADVAVRFTPPSPGVWRLSFTEVNSPRRTYNPFSVSVHGPCADGAPGAVQRCLQGDNTLALALATPVTVVVDGCRYEAPCRVTLRAERVDPSPAAPELSEVHLFRVGERLVVTGSARDPDDDLRFVAAELLDADGLTLPQPNGATLVTGFWAYLRERDTFSLPLDRPPPRVVRARIFVEDATARRSAALEAPVEDPPIAAAGARCDPRGYPTTCGDAARCVYSRSTGYVCVARLEVHHDAEAASLRVDLNPHALRDEPVASALVEFLDAAGTTLGQAGPLAWNPGSVYQDQRLPLLSFERWLAPAGLARVRVTMVARSGAPLGAFEAPVLSPATLRPFEACDPTTNTRARCPEGYVCGDVDYSSALFQCRERVVACPGEFASQRWAPQTGRAVVDGGPTGRFASRVSCLRGSDSTWGAAVDFVAPRAGTYRFTLTAPSAPERADFSLSLRRYCALGGPASELACAPAAVTRAPTLTATAAAGEHVPLIVSAQGASLQYRLEVTVDGE